MGRTGRMRGVSVFDRGGLHRTGASVDTGAHSAAVAATLNAL